MRNNNIIIVKCFISSFAGKHIHQSSRGGWVEVGGGDRRNLVRGRLHGGSAVVSAFI